MLSCGNCGWEGVRAEAAEIQVSGESKPVCPHCGGLEEYG